MKLKQIGTAKPGFLFTYDEDGSPVPYSYSWTEVNREVGYYVRGVMYWVCFIHDGVFWLLYKMTDCESIEVGRLMNLLEDNWSDEFFNLIEAMMI